MLAVLILLRAAPVAAQDRASLVLPSVVLVGAQAADLHATHLVLSRGGVEHNPIMRQPLGTQAAIKALTTTAVVGGAYVLNKHRRPRASKIVVWSASAAVFAVAAHNYRHAQR